VLFVNQARSLTHLYSNLIIPRAIRKSNLILSWFISGSYKYSLSEDTSKTAIVECLSDWNEFENKWSWCNVASINLLTLTMIKYITDFSRVVVRSRFEIGTSRI